jgi:hypothetical protein
MVVPFVGGRAADLQGHGEHGRSQERNIYSHW